MALIAFSSLIFTSCTSTNKEYYPDGKLKSMAEFKNGKQNGAYRTYFKNGNLEKEGNFIDGKLQGKFNEYERGGKIRTVSYFTNGIQDSTMTTYFENGTISMQAHFKNGKQDGNMKVYNSKGKLTSEQEFKEGMLDGQYKRYYDNGTIERIEFYKDNRAVYSEEHDKVGNFKGDFRKISVKGPEKIKLGEEYVATIEAFGPITNYDNESCELQIQGKYSLTPEKAKDGKFTFKYKPTKSGEIKIAGTYLLHIKEKVSRTKFEINFKVE